MNDVMVVRLAVGIKSPNGIHLIVPPYGVRRRFDGSNCLQREFITILSSAILIGCLVGSAFSAAAAGESSGGWPHVRGPSFDSNSTEQDLANSWPVEGPPVLWSR